jgi:Zn-dependent alcohol dehydrogenase
MGKLATKYVTRMLVSLFVLSLLCAGSLAFFFPWHSKIALTTASSNMDDAAADIIGLAPGVLSAASPETNLAHHNPKISHDVWIVGAGTLGELVIKGLRSKSAACRIIGETKSSVDMSAITNLGAEHRARDARTSIDEGSAKNVVICLPPSCAKDYAEEVHAATRLWAGPQGGGNLVFTSSIGVYGESSGNIVDEAFRVDTRSASATR